MVDTYKLMNQIRLSQFSEKSNEELVAIYQNEVNQSALAEIFCKNFKLFCSVVYESKYRYIDNADKVDSVLQSLHKGMLRFKIENGVSFNTFIVRCIRGRLATQISYFTQKRHQGITYSLDAMRENTDNEEYNINIITAEDTAFENVELSVDFSLSGLSEREKLMCKLIMNNPKISNSELSKALNCHRHTVAKEKSGLQTKLAYLL